MKKPKSTPPMRPTSRTDSASDTDAPLAARDHFRREKARRARHSPADSEAMASAKREYQALLEANSAKGRGGRPKKQPVKPHADEDVADDEPGTE